MILFCLMLNPILAQEKPFDEDQLIARVGDYDIKAKEYQSSLEYRLMAIQKTQGRIITPDRQFRVDTLTEMIDSFR